MTREMDIQKTESQSESQSRRGFSRALGIGTTVVLEGALLAGCVSQRLKNPDVTPGGGASPRPSEVPTGVSSYDGLVLDSQDKLDFLTNVGKITGISEYQGPQAVQAGIFSSFIQEKNVDAKRIDMIGFEAQTEQGKRAYIFLLADNKGSSGKSDDTLYMAFREYKDSNGNLESIDFITDSNWVDSTDFTFIELSHELLPDGTPAYLVRGKDDSITPVVINRGGSILYTFYTKNNEPTPVPPTTANDISFRLPNPNPPTVTPTTSPTFAPTPTLAETVQTPEIGHFKVCSPEHYLDCKVTPEELFDGSYKSFLETLSKPFDPNKIADVPLVWVKGYDDLIFYSNGSAPNYDGPNFTVEGSEPFRRDVTAAYTEVTDANGLLHKYIVLPIEFYDKNNPDKNQWVITVLEFFNRPPVYKPDPPHALDIWQDTLDQMTYKLNIWKNQMKQTPIRTTSVLPWESPNNVSPLVDKTFKDYPDMQLRFARFVEGDVSALSDRGIVLLSVSSVWSNHKME